MGMTEQLRQKWNTAVDVHATDPSEENVAYLETVKRECLDAIHRPIVEECIQKQNS